MKSIGLKLGILYIFLSIINIAFFTILVHENQIDLITKVKKYESIELASDIIDDIASLIYQIRLNPQDFASQALIEEKIVEKCEAQLSANGYLLFTLDKAIVHQSSEDFPFHDDFLWTAQNAITRKEFSNKPFTANFLSEEEIHFYVPLDLNTAQSMILLFRLDISDIRTKLDTIYRMILIFVIFLIIFHIIFGFILHRIVVSPINVLAKKSNAISQGNYETRVKLKKNDEFGVLTKAFNHMASSIQEKIQNLKSINKEMRMELEMAGIVQKSIYPVVRQTDFFDMAIYHQPYIEVSGDYHDIFPIGKEKYGFIIADVSGHGVSAALITMLIKEKCEEIAADFTDPKDFFIAINTLFGDFMQKYNKFFTAFYFIIDSQSHMITYSNAGQPYPLLLRDNSLSELNTNGIIIGIEKNMNSLFESKKMGYREKDRIIILTDGIYETVNSRKEQFGDKRLQDSILKAKALPIDDMLKSILADIASFRGKVNPVDDETLIIIEIKKSQGIGLIGPN